MHSIILFNEYLDPFVWIIAAVRQYKTRYFYYFLFNALCDPIGIIYESTINHSNNIPVYLVLGYLTFVALFPIKKVKENLIAWLVPLFLLIAYLAIYIQLHVWFILLMVIHLFILFRLLYDLLEQLYEEKIFDIFISVIIFYELTNLTKLGSIVTGLNSHVFYYYLLTNVFVTLIGMFFVILKYGNRKFVFELK
jgi:hypothetical protein